MDKKLLNTINRLAGIVENPSDVNSNKSLFEQSRQGYLNQPMYSISQDELNTFTKRGIAWNPENPIFSSDQRAYRQTTAEKWGNALGKMSVYTAATALDNTVGWMFTPQGAVSSGNPWDNWWGNNVTDAMMEWADKAMPHYTSSREQSTMWLKNAVGFGDKGSFHNFWGDMFLKNMGFTFGAVIGGGLTSSALYKVGTKAFSKRLSTEAVKAISKNPKAYAQLSKKYGKKALDEALTNPTTSQILLNELQTISKTAKNINTASTLGAAVLGASAEAGIEARHGYNNNLDLYLSKGYSQEDAERMASAAGNVQYVANMGILSLSNFAQFRSVLQPRYKPKADFGDLIDIDKTKRTVTGRKYTIGEKTFRLLRNPVIEGSEEISQGFAGKFATDFTLRQNDPETAGLLGNIIESGIESVKSLDEDTAQEGFIGAVTGALMIPNFRRMMGGKGPMFTGGIYESYTNIKENEKKAGEYAESLNNIVSQMNNDYGKIVATLSHQRAADEAAFLNDQFTYENEATQSITNHVRYFEEAGKLQDYYDMLKDMSNLSASDIRELHKSTTEEGDLVDPTINKSDEQVEEEHRKGIAKVKKQAERAVEITRQVEEVLSFQEKTFPSILKDQLVGTLVAAEDSKQRFDKVITQLDALLQTKTSPVLQGKRNVLELVGRLMGKVDTFEDSQGNIITQTAPYTYEEMMEDFANLVINDEVEKINSVIQGLGEALSIEGMSKKFLESTLFSEGALKSGPNGEIINNYAANINDVAAKVLDIFKLAAYNRSMVEQYAAIIGDPINWQTKSDEDSKVLQEVARQNLEETEETNDLDATIQEELNQLDEQPVKPEYKGSGAFYAVEKQIAELKEELAAIEKKMAEANEASGPDMLRYQSLLEELDSISQEEVEKEIQRLTNILNSYLTKTKQNTKKGKRASEKIKSVEEKFKDDIRESLKAAQELLNILKEKQATKERLEAHKQEILNEISYYENLINKEGVESFEDIENKLNKRKAKLKTINKILAGISKSIKKAASLLKSLVDYVFGIESMIDGFNFKPKTRKDLLKLSQTSEGEIERQLYLINKKLFDEANKELNQAIDNVELQEAKIEKLTKERDALIKEQQKLTKEIELLTRLLDDAQLYEMYEQEEGIDPETGLPYETLVAEETAEAEEAPKTVAEKANTLTEKVNAILNDKSLLGKVRPLITLFNKYLDEATTPQEVQEVVNAVKAVIYKTVKKAILGRIDSIEAAKEKVSKDNKPVTEPEESADEVDTTNQEVIGEGFQYEGRHPDNVLTGLTSNQLLPDDKTIKDNNSDKRYHYFIQNNDITKYSIKIVPFSDKFKGANKVIDYNPSAKEQKEIFIAIVVNSKGEYVNLKGEPISEDKLIEQGIMSTMPEPSFQTKSGKNKYYTPEDIEDINTYIANRIQEYTEFRERYKQLLNEGKEVIVPLVGITQGMEKIVPAEEKLTASMPEFFSGVPRSNIEIKIAVSENTVVGNTTIRTRPGRIYGYDKSTNKIFPINNKTFEQLDTSIKEGIKNSIVEAVYNIVNQNKVSRVGSVSNIALLQSLLYMPMEDSESSWLKIEKDKNGHPSKVLMRVDGKFAELPKNVSREDLATILNLDSRYIHAKLGLLEKNKDITIPLLDKNGKVIKTINSKYSDFLYDSALEMKYTKVEDYIPTTEEELTGEGITEDNFLYYNAYPLFKYEIKGEKAAPKAEGVEVEDRELTAEELALIQQMEGYAAITDAQYKEAQNQDGIEGLPLEDSTQKEATKEDSKTEEVDEFDDLLEDETTSKEDVDTKNKFNNKFGLPRVKTKGQTNKKQDLYKAYLWLAKTFGRDFARKHFVPLYNSYSNSLNGYLQDSVIYIFENAEVGTVYHEAFHAVTQLFLTKEEREELYADYRKAFKGQTVTDINGNNVVIDENTSGRVIEELLAEDYRDYKLTGQVKDYSEKSLKNRIVKFFKNIARFLKEVILRRKQDPVFNSKINKLFKSIDNGKFSNAKVLTPSSERFNSEKNSPIKGLTYSEVYQAVDNYHALFINEILNEENFEGVINTKTFFTPYEILYNTDPVIKDKLYEIIKEKTVQSVKETLQEGNPKHALILNNLKVIQQEHVKLLEEFSVKINDAEIESDIVVEEEDKMNSEDIYAKRSIELSAKETVNNLFRFLASGIIKFDSTGDVKVNTLGLVELDENAINVLVNKLAGIQSFADLNNRLEQMYGWDPANSKGIKYLFDRLGLSKFNETLGQEEFNRAKSFLLKNIITSFSNNRNNYQASIIGKGGKVVKFDANRNNVKKRIIDKWQQNYYNTNPNFLLKDNLIVQPKSFKGKYKAETLEGLVEFLNKNYGTDFRIDAINLLNDTIKNKFISNAESLLNNYKDNIFAYDSNVVGYLDYLIEVAEMTSVDNVDNMHNEGNVRVYTVGMNTFHSIMLNYLNNLEEGVSIKDVQKVYPHFKDSFLSNSLWLNTFLFDRDGLRTPHTIEKVMQRTIQEEGKSETLTSFSKATRPEKLVTILANTFSDEFHAIRASDNSIENVFKLKYNVSRRQAKKTAPVKVDKRSLYRNATANTESTTKEDAKVSLDPTSNSTLVRRYSEIYKNYLRDELMVYEDNTQLESIKFKNFGKAKKELGRGVFIDLVKELGSQELLSDYEAMFAGQSVRMEDVETFMAEHSVEIDSIFETFVESKTDDLVELFQRYKLVQKDKKGNYENIGLPIFKVDAENLEVSPTDPFTGENQKTFTEEELKLIARTFTIKQSVGFIEQTKLFTGNPIYFKDLVDFFKRQSGLTGTKKLSLAEDVSVIRSLNKNSKRLDGKQLKENSPSASLTLLEDVEQPLSKKEIQDLNKLIKDKNVVAAYEKNINYGDAMSFGTLDAVREFYELQGIWHPEMEKRYQLEMQQFAKFLINNAAKENKKELEEMYFTGKDSVFGKHTDYAIPSSPKYMGKVIEDKNLPVLPSLKPQYFGPAAGVRNEGEVEVINGSKDRHIPLHWKTSVLPLAPSLMIDFETGKVKFPKLLELTKTMMMNQEDFRGYVSSSKGESIINQGRNEDNSVNSSVVSFEMYYKYLGTQLELSNYYKQKVATGTQMVAHFIADLYDNGKAVNEELGILGDEYLRLNNARIQIGVDNLKKELGIVETDDTAYYSLSEEGLEKMITKLKQTAGSRNFSENELNNLERNLREGLGIDFLMNRIKIEQVLSSIADSAIRTKRYGAANAQVSELYFESNTQATLAAQEGQLKDSEGNLINPNALNFYSPTYDKDGKIIGVKGLEVYLPNPFKGEFANMSVEEINKMDPKLLMNIIGFRIPTQGLNSIDFITVKGFLPASAGNIVVVPGGLIGKTGSDFDIDKLNIFLPNYEKVGGKLKYINYIKEKDSDVLFSRYLKKTLKEEANEELKNIATEAEVIDDIENLEENILKLAKGTKAWSILTNLKNKIDRLNKLEEYKDSEYYKNFLNSSLEEQNGVKAVENEMINKGVEIMTHPDNFSNLVRSIDSNLIFNTRNEILFRKTFKKSPRDAKGNYTTEFNEFVNELKAGKKYYDLIDPVYHMNKTEELIQSKSGVGSAADHSKSHVLFQKHAVKFNSAINVKYAGDSVEISSENNLTNNKNLSSVKTKGTDENISYLINLILSGFVDGAKDPQLMQLNINPGTASTALALAREGTPFEEIALLMSQPVVDKFLLNREIYESAVAEVNGNKLYRDTRVKTVRNKKGELELAPLKEGDTSIVLETIKDIWNEVSDVEITPMMLAELNNMYYNILLNGVDSNNKFIFDKNNLESIIEKEIDSVSSENILNYMEENITILAEFIRATEKGKKLNEVVQYLKFDTQGLMKDSNTLELKMIGLHQLLEANTSFFGDFLGLNDLINEESFIKVYKDAVRELSSNFTKMQPLFYDNVTYPASSSMYQKYLSKISREVLNSEEASKALNSFKTSMVTYILLKGKNITTEETQSLLTDINSRKKSFPRQFSKLIQSSSRLRVLQNYFTVTVDTFRNTKDGKASYMDSITLKTLNLSKRDKDIIANVLRDIHSTHPTLVEKLFKVALAQSGTKQSYASFHNIFPEEVIYNYTAEILSKLNDQTILDGFEDFYHSENIENDYIVPSFKSRKQVIKRSPNSKYIKLKYDQFEDINQIPPSRRQLTATNSQRDVIILFKKEGDMYYPMKPNIASNTTKKTKSIMVDTLQQNNRYKNIKPIKVETYGTDIFYDDFTALNRESQPTQQTSEVEAKKADKERRRQNELDLVKENAEENLKKQIDENKLEGFDVSVESSISDKKQLDENLNLIGILKDVETVTFEINKDGNLVGFASFFKDSDGKWYANNINIIDNSQRRKGIMSYVYNNFIKAGYDLKKSKDQTLEGELFWERKNKAKSPLDKINAKYDAELAALESTQQASEVTEESPFESDTAVEKIKMIEPGFVLLYENGIEELEKVMKLAKNDKVSLELFEETIKKLKKC